MKTPPAVRARIIAQLEFEQRDLAALVAELDLGPPDDARAAALALPIYEAHLAFWKAFARERPDRLGHEAYGYVLVRVGQLQERVDEAARDAKAA